MLPCENPMELKDIISISMSMIALLLSSLAIYFSYWNKSTKALLCLNSRLFDCLGGKTIRELSYTFSNIGNQELYIKDISLLRGQSPLGNLKHESSYLVIPSNEVNPFVIKPGEIRTFMLSHNVKYGLPSDYDELKNKYIVVSLEVISANGKRFQITHDITTLSASGPDLKDKIWEGISLGASI